MGVTSERLTIPEVARRLGIPGPEVYELIFAGKLDGTPGPDGAVTVGAAEVAEFERRLGKSSTSR